MDSVKCLAVLLFHNDEDLVEDQIKYYKYKNKHDLIVFNHNSNDQTSELINKYKDDILCVYELTDQIDFKKNEVHITIYKILMGHQDIKKDEIKMSNEDGYNLDFTKNYDWISFPESDEFLEGPDRTKTYYEHICSIHDNPNIDKISFSNVIFWFTDKDDPSIKSPIERIKHYCHRQKCCVRLYAWRANKTVIRRFGHGKRDDKNVVNWKTRHYEIRSLEHFYKKTDDRLHIAVGGLNKHYRIMYNNLHNKENYGIIHPDELHYDDGVSELNMEEIFNWRKIA